MLALAAGKGSRGVTTAAIALAAVWPTPRRVVLAECDPAGGSLAVRFGLRPSPGLVSLGSVARRGLESGDIWAHVQALPGSGLEVLLAPAWAEQSIALGGLWATLPHALAGLDADVVVDCGRLTPGSPVEPLLRAADLVVLVCTPTAEGVHQLQGRITALGALGVRPRVLLVGESPYDVQEVQRLLDVETRAEVIGALAADAHAAGVLSGEPGGERRFTRSLLVRSARQAAERLNALLEKPPAAPPPVAAEPLPEGSGLEARR